MSIPSVQDDLEIIAQLRLGKVQAYEAIVVKYQGKIRAFCKHMLGDEALAEDAAQETFIRAYQSINKFQPKALFSTWLFKIARNHCIDLLRKNKIRAAGSLDKRNEELGEASQGLYSNSSATEDVLEARSSVRALLAELSPDNREIVILREMYGLSYEELADILSLSLDAVKSRLKRARALILKQSRHFLDSENVSSIKDKSNEQML